MVEQRQYILSQCWRWQIRAKRRLRYSIIIDLPIKLRYLLLRRLRRSGIEMERFIQRRWHVKETNFNFSIFSTLDCLRLFRFHPQSMSHVFTLFSFPRWTVRKGYFCTEITSVHFSATHYKPMKVVRAGV